PRRPPSAAEPQATRGDGRILSNPCIVAPGGAGKAGPERKAGMQLSPRAAPGRGRKLAEAGFIVAGEVAEMREAPGVGDRGHRAPRAAGAQVLARVVEANTLQIRHRPGTAEIVEALEERARAHAGDGDDVLERERSAGVEAHELLGAAHVVGGRA